MANSELIRVVCYIFTYFCKKSLILVNLKVIIFGKLQLKKIIMKGLKLSNSIYASKMMLGKGLDVQGGRLINNRPDSMSGIAQAAVAKKAMKRMDKIDVIAAGVSMGDMRSDMMEGEY